MRYIADHDYHIHSTISPCCHDENQTPETILNYAKENNGYITEKQALMHKFKEKT